MNYNERFDKYNLLDKDVLIAMLIEIDINKESLSFLLKENGINNPITCNFYIQGTETSTRCMNCGQLKYNHEMYW